MNSHAFSYSYFRNNNKYISNNNNSNSNSYIYNTVLRLIYLQDSPYTAGASHRDHTPLTGPLCRGGGDIINIIIIITIIIITKVLKRFLVNVFDYAIIFRVKKH